MSLVNTVVKQIFQGNDVLVDFAIPFDIIENASDETVVYLRDETDLTSIVETLQVEGVDYNLTGVPIDNVQFVTPPTSDDKVLVKRTKDLEQSKDFLNSARTDVEALEEGLDIATALIQELLERVDRAPLLPVTTTKPAFIMPEPQATRFWGFDASINFKLFTSLELATLLNDNFLVKTLNLSDLSSVPGALINLGISPYETNLSVLLNNNQAGAIDITGISGLGATDSSLLIELELARKDDGNEIMANVELILQRLPSSGTWRILDPSWDGDDGVIDTLNPAGVTFSLRVSGVDIFLQYVSDNMVGGNYDTANSLIKASIKRFQ